MSDKIYVPGMGNYGAKLFILGESPSDADLKSEKPFSGPEGKELDKILKETGIERGDCWLSHVFKEYIPPSPSKKKIPVQVRAKNAGIDVDKTLEELQNEINSIKPNCILGLSSGALWALTGKTSLQSYRGSIMQGMGRKCVNTFHPRDLTTWTMSGGEMSGYQDRQIMMFDFRRALKQSQFPELQLPQRTLQICRSSYELAEFRKLYRNHKRMSVDIESSGTCIPVCIGLAFTKHHGMCIPLWNEDGISNIPTADLVQIWIILQEMLYEKDIIGANFNYDRDKLRRIGFVIRKLVSDTMYKAFAINPELLKGLAFNTSIYTEEPFYKNEGMYEGSMQDLFFGCARDSCVTVEVEDAMEPDLIELNQGPFYYNYLMKLPELYAAIEEQGFNIDPIKRDDLLRKYVEWDERLRYELFKLLGEPLNVNSPKQVWIMLFDVLKCPPRQGTGEEELTSLLNLQSFTDERKRRVVEIVLEDRRVRKSVSTYLMALPDYDGRMRTTFFPCLDTGRSSTGQQDPPIRPSIEVTGDDGKKKKKVFGTAFQTMTKHGDIGEDIRSMYVPDSVKFTTIENVITRVEIPEEDEEVFVQADSAQAEARVVFLLADDEQALYDIDHHDYHALTASWFFGGTESTYSKKVLGYESPIRFAGKTLRHAGHLGAGKRRAAISVNTDARKYKIPISITEQVAERALKIFHSKQPKIQGVFQAGIVEALKQNRRLIAPVPYGVDAEIGGTRTFFERWGDELFRQAFSYIPQRSITDNTKSSALRIRSRIPNIKIVMESHDALLFCIRKSLVESQGRIIKEEMERPIDFRNCSMSRRFLSIPCEIETGINYQDMKKFKFVFQEQIEQKAIELETRKKTVTEEFEVVDIPGDTRLDSIIYSNQEIKKFLNS